MSGVSWRSPVARQWIGLLAALVAATVLAYLSEVFWRIDLSIYDAASSTGPAPADVVIIAVDDPSLAALGRWPWPRAMHAALLDRLRAAGVRGAALDFLLTEADPNAPDGDAALAESMSRGPPTVLPSFAELSAVGGPREQLPIPMLARAAAGIGHAQLEIDRDGIVRSVFLREGPGAPTRLHLAAALLTSIPGMSPPRLLGERRPEVAASHTAWVRDYRMLIPFLGPPGHFAQVSYVDVLRGAVSDSTLRGKIVLVGLTAQGAGDAFPTASSGHSRPMPGVEVTANVLEALREGTAIREVSRPVTIMLGLAPVAVVALGLWYLAPRQSLLLTVVLWVVTLAASVLAVRIGHWWWPPTAPLGVLLLAYPLWSWRRLEATQAFLDDELERLASERFPLMSGPPATAKAARYHDFLQRRIDLVRQATQRLRALQREREDIVRFLSHDMKSPATSLLGLAQLQRDPGRALPPSELSQRLDLLAQRMLTLLDSFVALARAESTNPQEFDDFDLRDAVQDAYDEVWAAAQARGIVVRVNVPDEPCMVSGDRQQLGRAIVNLLGNAIKFSSGGSRVDLLCERGEGEVAISVADEGPGIAPEHRTMLFQRFSRGVRGARSDPGGAGLGLAFVRVVAEKHGGRAWAEHHSESRTTFRLSLPAGGAKGR